MVWVYVGAGVMTADEMPYLPHFKELFKATSIEELVKSFDHVVKSFGMDRHCLFEILPQATHWQQHLVLGTFPEEYIAKFWSDRRTYDSSVIHQTKLSGIPFLTADLINNPNITDREREAWEKARDVGIIVGISFPVKGRYNRIAGVSLTGDPNVLDEYQIWLLSCLAAGYYSRACALDGGVEHLIVTPKTYALTGRERECLTWVAMGKTDREIAESLDISERTVVFHIKNAKTKLGASTRLQAVLTAIRNVEIIL